MRVSSEAWLRSVASPKSEILGWNRPCAEAVRRTQTAGPESSAACCEQHVGGFQIAVDDAGAMSVLHRASQVLDQAGGMVGIERAGGEPVAQVGAVHVLHRQER